MPSSVEQPLPACTRPQREPIDRGLSIYFDLVRVVAAAVVLLSHYGPSLFGASDKLFPGHDAVVVFFVLSGYVIAYVVDTKDATVGGYALDRLSRLWSVAIPAAGLALIAVLLTGGRAIEGAAGSTRGTPNAGDFLLRIVANLLFQGESWAWDLQSTYNSPMWSLNYEAWYYAIFGAWMFSAGRVRVWMTLAACALGGPKILLLMPCWLAGVALYKWRHRLQLPVSSAYALFFVTIGMYAVAYSFHLTLASREWLRWLTSGESYHLGPSTSVIGDYVLAPLIAGHFIAVSNMPLFGRILARVRKPIGGAASYTLSLYLYYTPLLVILYGGLNLPGVGVLVIAVVFVMILGTYTEHRRRDWRAWIATIAEHLVAVTVPSIRTSRHNRS